MKKQYYILFDNHTNGMALYNELKSREFKTTISPTPRQLSTCCGISLMINEEDVDAIRAVIDEGGFKIIGIEFIERDINKNRDVYC